VYETAERPADPVDETLLRNALTVRVRRRVRRDSTLPLDGTDWGDQPRLPRRAPVTVARCLVETLEPPWIEHEGKRLLLRPIDAVGNSPPQARCRARASRPAPPRPSPSGPAKALLDRAVGRTPSDGEGSR
jgi:putative transposase